MDENTVTIIVLVILAVLILVVPSIRVRSAVNGMIKRFRNHQALDEKSARTAEQLGVRLTSVTPNTLFGGGDPNQAAMSEMRQANVIMMTDDGRLYLSEANLARSKWNQAKS